MLRLSVVFVLAFLAISLLGSAQVAAQDTAKASNRDARRVASDETEFPKFAEFADIWQDEQWVPRESRRFPQHIRDLEDTGWQVRMLALHEVVSAAESAVPFLLERLQSGESHERILAAQALGYLAKHVKREPLLEAFANEEDAAVQLYLADALGMRGDAELAQQWEELKGGIRNRDVRRHMGYAEERAGAAVEDAIVEELASWKPDNINTAEVGKPAPEFELSTVGGEQVKLSEFRGKKNIVLVFIYGDT